jgi:diacylglycerol O-acyltransferase/trehalose O-mycolyltransferase
MRRLLGLVLLAAVALQVRPAPADAACPPPRCLDAAVPVPPGIVVPERTVRVILPVGYDPDGPRRYPVLYLLHGAGDTYRSWTERTDVLRFSRRFPLIIVMPDGGHGPDAGWYSDWADGSRQWETFHTRILPAFIDATFRTLGPGHRAVAGLSMGGFGAMSYAARHPGLFQAAASFSGAVDTRYLAPVSGIGFELAHERFGTPDDRVWGDQLADAPTWRAHNPTDLAPRLAGVWLFVATGTGTPGGPAGDDLSDPAGYAVEAFILQLNLSFARALLLARVPFVRDFYLGGYHGWSYWERELHRALPGLVAAAR